MAHWLRRLGDGLLDLLFPPLCVACGAPSAQYLCDACAAAITRLPPPLCHCCGVPLEPLRMTADDSFRGRASCRRCRTLPADFEVCRAYGAYEGALRAAILALKYRGKTAVVPALAGLLARVVEEEPALRRARTLVPVPLHPRRLRHRGFNQAELLAAELAARTGMVLRRDLIVKARHTRPQVGLNAEQRRENLRDAFAFRGDEPLQGPVLLLDDVITTGATFHECARTLRAAGVTSVYAIALAHD